MADAAVKLWQPLASQLIAIIGESGFRSLFARSLFLTRMVYQWLPAGNASQPADLQFIDLKASLGKRGAAEASQANGALLLTFTNTLASLIGEALTASILSSAWGIDAPTMDQTDKSGQEFPNE